MEIVYADNITDAAEDSSFVTFKSKDKSYPDIAFSFRDPSVIFYSGQWFQTRRRLSQEKPSIEDLIAYANALPEDQVPPSPDHDFAQNYEECQFEQEISDILNDIPSGYIYTGGPSPTPAYQTANLFENGVEMARIRGDHEDQVAIQQGVLAQVGGILQGTGNYVMSGLRGALDFAIGLPHRFASSAVDIGLTGISGVTESVTNFVGGHT